MWSKFKDAVLSKQVLEAVIAAAVYGGSRGQFGIAEKDQLRVSIFNNPKLAKFTREDVDRLINTFTAAIKDSPRSGVLQLRKEIQQGATSEENKELILLTMLDVIDHGGLKPEEENAVHDVAEWLGLSATKYGLPPRM